MSRLFLLFAVLSFAGAPTAAPPKAPRATADEVFSKVKGLVYQLKTAVRADAPKRSYGSAFVVGTNGRLMTNYHVVSDVVQYPQKYKIFLETEETSIEAKLLALDVVHDLAVIQVPMTFTQKFEFDEKSPPQGSRLFSLGLPQDLNLSIIEATYNESIQHGLYEELHLSSPLNSGMSGGPTVSPAGKVVGINVSMLNDSQNVSFAVPAFYAVELLGVATRHLASSKPVDWQPEITRQLMGVQDQLTEDLMEAGKETTSFEGWRVPKPPAYLKCWGDDATERKQAYSGYRQVCYLPFSSYLASSLTTGTLEFRYEVYSPGTLNPLQFATLLSHRYNDFFEATSDFILSLSDEEHSLLTDAQCHENRFKNKAGVDLKVNYCLRAYLRHPDMVDADFKWITPVSDGPAMIVKGTLRGFHRSALAKILELQWDGLKREGK